jgi:putative ABC transport system permease protein
LKPDDLDEEIRSHLDLEVQRNIESGMTPEEARAAALRVFGNVTRTRERVWELRPTAWLDSLRQDLRYALRTLRRSPGFTTVAVLSLAIGIGATTAIFSVVHAVLLRSLPYRDPERLVRIWETNPRRRMAQDRVTVSPVNFLGWSRNHPNLFEAVAASTSGLNQTLTLTGYGEPLKLLSDRISADFFRVLGAQPLLGRTFFPEEERPGQDEVVLLSYGLWQTRFGADPQVVGRSITLDSRNYCVIGVLPPGFRSPDRLTSPDNSYLLRPLTFQADQWTDRGQHFLNVVARLRPDATLEQAQTVLSGVARQVEHEFPERDRGWGVRVVPLQADVVGSVRRTLLVLLGAVAFVLVIACANAANLLLARAGVQAREMAVRAALGAGRSRLVRQLLAQSLLVGLAAGALGVLLAFWGAGVLLEWAPKSIPRLEESSVDLPVLGFALLVSLVTGVVFGLAPALQASRPDLNEALKETGRSSTGSSSTSRFRSALVVMEVAVAMVLVIGAGLLVRTFRAIQSVDPGYRPENVLIMDIAPPSTKYQEPFERVAFFQQVLERAGAVPGVRVAAVVSHFPLGGTGGGSFAIEGRTPRDPRDWDAEFRSISLDYFRALSIPLLEGRWFTAQDGSGSVPVAVINQTMARRFWPNGSSLGKRIRRGPHGMMPPPGMMPWITVVGIVGDVRHDGPTRATYAEAYLPYQQPFAAPRFPFPRELVVRTDIDPTSLVPALQREVWAVDKDQPVSRVRTLKGLHGNSMSQQRFNMLLVSLFGAMGLLLAAVGIYGVLSYLVARRIHEIGIRMALGAQRGRILRMVVAQGMGLAVLGVALGVAAALGLTRVLSTLLFGVRPTDPITFTAVAVLLLGVALAACYIPAWRATRIDPMAALRHE